MITTQNKYPKEFHEWKEWYFKFFDDQWQTFKEGEKDWTPVCKTEDELYKIYLAEKKY